MTAIDHALEFLDAQPDPLGAAWVRHVAAWVRHVAAGAPAAPVLDALAAHQADDGGFRDLEVDIAAPVSNPFAARLAMIVLASLDPLPDAGHPVMQRLGAWLESEQSEDGDWHFRPEVREHRLAPWFAGWTFPSLNPAACLAGYAHRLGLGSDRLHGRVRTLFDRLATPEAAATGQFYDVLPYVEYLGAVAHPQRDTYLDALAGNIAATAARGGYDDAEHFFVHVVPGGPDLARRLPDGLIVAQLDRLEAEQQADGGWSTPYDAAWRPWDAAWNAVTLWRRSRGR